MTETESDDLDGVQRAIRRAFLRLYGDPQGPQGPAGGPIGPALPWQTQELIEQLDRARSALRFAGMTGNVNSLIAAGQIGKLFDKLGISDEAIQEIRTALNARDRLTEEAIKAITA